MPKPPSPNFNLSSKLLNLSFDTKQRNETTTPNTMTNLQTEIEKVLNRHSAENGSNTPDFILAEYLTGCLAAFNRATNAREKWHGRDSGELKGLTSIENDH